MVKKKSKLILSSLFISVIFLSACTSDEEKQALAYKNNGKLFDSYAEYVVKPVLEKEKTSEEVVEDLVKKELNYEVLESYKKVGISNPNKVADVLAKVIYDDKDIPNTPRLSKDLIDNINDQATDKRDSEVKKELAEKLDKLIKSQKNKSEEDLKKEEERKLQEMYEKEYEEAQENVNKEINPDSIYAKQKDDES